MATDTTATRGQDAAADKTALKQRLLTPGPTAVPPRVLQEMALPIIHHRTKQFQAIFAELNKSLQQVFRTRHPVLSIAGSGTTSFEAAQISLARPGSKVLAVATGKFGERWQDIFDAYAKFLDLTPLRIDVPWGQGVNPDQVADILKKNPDVSVVALCHSETSTCTASDVEAVAKITRGTDALLLVDGITSVGAFPCEMDAWGIDCLVTGSQKAMMLPPGLGYVGLGERAQQRLKDLPRGPHYNLDLRRWLKSWQDNDVPFTPPVSLIRGQKVACDLILDPQTGGLDGVIRRTEALARGTRAAFEAMGLELISASPSPSVTGAFYPDGVDDSAFRKALREKHGVHITGGQDGRGAKWKGKIFRVSHMGYVDAEDTRAGLTAIATELAAMGHPADREKTLAAFEKAHG